MSLIEKPSFENGYLAAHVQLLASSYSRLTGRELLGSDIALDDIGQALFKAPFGLVSHGTESIPVFNYGNQTALKAFDLQWSEFMRLASRDSAEEVNQAERELLMAKVKQEGFIDNYRGIRISSSGRRFWIERATIWNVLDESDNYKGQAAIFHLNV